MAETKKPFSDYNKTELTGRLTDVPELRFTSTGRPLVSGTIASHRGYVDAQGNTREESHFFKFTWFGPKAQAWIESGPKKGDRVRIEGRLAQQRWEKDGVKRSSVEIQVYAIDVPGRKPEPSAETPSGTDDPSDYAYHEQY